MAFLDLKIRYIYSLNVHKNFKNDHIVLISVNLEGTSPIQEGTSPSPSKLELIG